MLNDIKLNYDDISIVPSVISTIKSRKECNPYDENGFLPIFASCMDSVVSIENTKFFNDVKIRTVIPRSIPIEDRLNYLYSPQNKFNFVAFSLTETKKYFNPLTEFPLNMSFPIKICIDLANGHMKDLLDTVKSLKNLHKDRICIMTGNIANPETYRFYEDAGVDYVRCSIGSGSVCLTASNVSCYYPVFSLIKEIYEIKQEINGKCKIIADGGIKGYGDIQKALIYADYVMIGGLFNKAIESSAKTTYGSFYWNIRGKKIYRPLKSLLYYGKEVPLDKYNSMFQLVKAGKLTIWKELFGMSSHIAQGLIAKASNIELKKLKTSEGKFKYQKVEYTIAGWAENETDYLRSIMSYVNARNLSELKNCQWVQNLRIAYNK